MKNHEKISKLANHFGWKFMAPEIAILAMENFIFKSSPPTTAERACYGRLVQKTKDEELVSYEEWKEIFDPLWLREEGRYSRYYHLLNELHCVLNNHREALLYNEDFDELEASPPEDGYDVAAWYEWQEELFKIDGLFRSYKKSAGKALEGLLLNAAAASGCDEKELIRALETIAEAPVLKKIEARASRPNARPIRAKHESALPDILFFTVHELEPHWDGVLLWLEQTHSVQNKWKAFEHLLRVNEKSLGCNCI